MSCISGNHVTDQIGKHICEYTDEDKKRYGAKYDADILVDDGVWIGANVTVLSGAHIAEGCVIAAGAVVTVPGTGAFPDAGHLGPAVRAELADADDLFHGGLTPAPFLSRWL